MSNESKIEVQSRREFVKTAAKVAVTAPAAAMLLSASVKSANAASIPTPYSLGDDGSITTDDAFADDAVLNPGDDLIP
jgi:hypothetical protein